MQVSLEMIKVRKTDGLHTESGKEAEGEQRHEQRGGCPKVDTERVEVLAYRQRRQLALPCRGDLFRV